MKIITSRDGVEVTRLSLSGELDMATVTALDDAVTAVLAADPPRCLVVDAAGLTFCDSSGIHAMLRARERAQSRATSFVMVNPTGMTRRTLEITGLLDTLTTATATIR